MKMLSTRLHHADLEGITKMSNSKPTFAQINATMNFFKTHEVPASNNGEYLSRVTNNTILGEIEAANEITQHRPD